VLELLHNRCRIQIYPLYLWKRRFSAGTIPLQSLR
jgi:hypothetical protein